MKSKVRGLAVSLIAVLGMFFFSCQDGGGGGNGDGGNGSGWREIGGSASGGGISNNSGDSYHPSLALNNSGNPVVAWEDNTDGDFEIYLKKWNGSGWIELGGSASGGGISKSSEDSRIPSLALGGSGNPVVVWREGFPYVYLKRWNGSKWVELGGSATGRGITGFLGGGSPSLDIGKSGKPFVAWDDGCDIFLKKWDGISWVGLGDSDTLRGISDDCKSECPSLAVDGSDNPVVAWLYDWTAIHLKKWDGANWIELGGSATGGGLSGSGNVCCPSLALDASGNPVVAWDSVWTGEIYLRKWNGTSWIGLGGSGGGDGISKNTGLSESPSLAVDSSGKPLVAWDSDTNEEFDYQIYLKKWDGSKWIQLDASATAGGVSDNSGYSAYPSLAVDGSGNPIVAWRNNWEIYLKRYVP